jgi:DNA-binding NtrC family response regulator
MTTPRPSSTAGRLAQHLREQERRYLLAALQIHDGHTGRTALWLGLSRRAIYEKLLDHGLEGEAAAMRTEAGIAGPRSSYVLVATP